MVTDAMAERKTVVDELSVDALFGLGGEADEGGGGYGAKKLTARRHLLSVALPSGQELI